MWDELEDAAEDYEKVRRNMDMHGFEGSSVRDYTQESPMPQQSSLQDNIDRCMGQLQRLQDLYDILNSKTSMSQKNYSDGLEDSSAKPRSEPGASEYANRVGVLWYRLEDLNDKIAALVDRLDL